MSIIQSGSIIESLPAIGVLKNPTGNVFIVDPSVSAYTLQDAIDDTVANNGDVIACLKGGQEVTATVNFNKAGIRVAAIGPYRNPLFRGEYFAIYAGSNFVDAPVAKVSQPCVIEGLGFASRDSGALFYSGAALLLGGDADATPHGVQILDCRFPKWGLDNRIGIAIEGSSDCLIEKCTFEGVTTNFAAGVYVQGATQNLVVRNNYFRDCDYAIVHGAFAGGGPHCIYDRNIMEDSKFLAAGGYAATGILTDNYSPYATGNTTYDDTVGTLQGLGLAISGNHYNE